MGPTSVRAASSSRYKRLLQVVGIVIAVILLLALGIKLLQVLQVNTDIGGGDDETDTGKASSSLLVIL